MVMNTLYDKFIISSSRNACTIRDRVEDVGICGAADESHPQNHCEREEETRQERKVRVGDEQRQVYQLNTIFRYYIVC